MIDAESFSSFDVSVSYAAAALDDSMANCLGPPNPSIYPTLQPYILLQFTTFISYTGNQRMDSSYLIHIDQMMF
jgi:hypothetical protein